jgi:hypothetical protein
VSETSSQYLKRRFSRIARLFLLVPWEEIEATNDSVKAIGSHLWNQSVVPGAGDILEQYKVVLEFADRAVARRLTVNSFYLTLNGAVVTIFGILWAHPPNAPRGMLLVPLSILLLECWAWRVSISSYRTLAKVRFLIAAELEKGLPCTPFGGAEHSVLFGGSDRRIYSPTTREEYLMPHLFALIYIVGFVAALSL